MERREHDAIRSRALAEGIVLLQEAFSFLERNRESGRLFLRRLQRWNLQPWVPSVAEEE